MSIPLTADAIANGTTLINLFIQNSGRGEAEDEDNEAYGAAYTPFGNGSVAVTFGTERSLASMKRPMK